MALSGYSYDSRTDLFDSHDTLRETPSRRLTHCEIVPESLIKPIKSCKGVRVIAQPTVAFGMLLFRRCEFDVGPDLLAQLVTTVIGYDTTNSRQLEQS